jgi:hypothetical protein
MLDTIISHITLSNPFSLATWFILGILGFSVWIFYRASKNPENIISWEHLVIDTSTNRASPYKVGYLVGIIVSSWIVITFADTAKLTFDILGMYLSYLLGGAGMNAFIKRTTPPADNSTKVPPTNEEDPKP